MDTVNNFNNFTNLSSNRVNSNLKHPIEISNENNFTKANTETIDKSNKNEGIDVEEEIKIPQEFNRLNECADVRPKKENTGNCIIYSDTSQPELEPYNKIFEDKTMSLSDFAKNLLQTNKEINQQKRLKNLLSTETNEKYETTVKSNNKQDQENEKKHSTKQKITFTTTKKKDNQKAKK